MIDIFANFKLVFGDFKFKFLQEENVKGKPHFFVKGKPISGSNQMSQRPLKRTCQTVRYLLAGKIRIGSSFVTNKPPLVNTIAQFIALSCELLSPFKL